MCVARSIAATLLILAGCVSRNAHEERLTEDQSRAIAAAASAVDDFLRIHTIEPITVHVLCYYFALSHHKWPTTIDELHRFADEHFGESMPIRWGRIKSIAFTKRGDGHLGVRVVSAAENTGFVVVRPASVSAKWIE